MNLDAWRHYLRGRFFELVRRPARAIDEYRAALALDPRATRIAHILAFLYSRRGEHAEAERHFRLVLAHEPGNAAAWFNLGFLHDQRRDLAAAIEAFREAVRLDPTLDRAWYGLGHALATLGRHAEALPALERAAALQPMNPYAWYHLGMTHYRLHDPDKVKEAILHLHRFDPKMARKLIRDAERPDLAHLVADLRV
jgi:tetratricopeptide (TPR) repeat protein